MAPNDRACKNHDELFPGHVSTLAVTDPEIIETFDNFAFDEVLRHGNLDVRTRLMVQLAAIIPCQALREYRVMLGAALTAGMTPVEAKEITVPGGPLRRHGQGLRFHPRHERGAHRTRRQPAPAGPVHDHTRERAEMGLAVQKQIIGDDVAEKQGQDQDLGACGCQADEPPQARKLAVVMHAMWVDGTFYCGDPATCAADVSARAAAKDKKLLGVYA